METNKSTNKRGPNDFVRQLMEIVDEAARYVNRHLEFFDDRCMVYVKWVTHGFNTCVKWILTLTFLRMSVASFHCSCAIRKVVSVIGFYNENGTRLGVLTCSCSLGT